MVQTPYRLLPPNDGLLPPNDGLLPPNDGLLPPNDRRRLHFDTLSNDRSPNNAAFVGPLAAFSAPPQMAFFANTLSVFVSRYRYAIASLRPPPWCEEKRERIGRVVCFT